MAYLLFTDCAAIYYSGENSELIAILHEMRNERRVRRLRVYCCCVLYIKREFELLAVCVESIVSVGVTSCCEEMRKLAMTCNEGCGKKPFWKVVAAACSVVIGFRGIR